MERGKRVDLILIILYPILASLLLFKLNTNLSLWSVFLYLMIPSLYLSFKEKKEVAKATLFSGVFITPLFFIVDYIATIGNQWVVTKTAFPFRVLGVVPIEDLLWGFFLAYFIIMFYEYFLDKHITHHLWEPKMKYLLVLIFLLLSLFGIIFTFSPGLFQIPYFYFWFGLILILIPAVLGVHANKKKTRKFFLTATYFFYLSLLYEIVALKLNLWYFPSETNFIGWVEMFGVRFPFEELFFWFILTALACLSWYTFFDDYNK